MIIDTATPGFTAQIYARNSTPNAGVFDVGPNGWVHVGGGTYVHATQTLRLTTDGLRYRYYLVWITSLGPHQSVSLNEVALYT